MNCEVLSRLFWLTVYEKLFQFSIQASSGAYFPVVAENTNHREMKYILFFAWGFFSFAGHVSKYYKTDLNFHS